MDNGLGSLLPISDELKNKFDELNDELSENEKIPVFHVGENLKIKGGKYRVHEIRKHKLILKPVGRRTKELHGEE